MNSSFISKYKPAIILTLALTIFLASSKLPGKSWVVSTLAGSGIPAQFDEPYGVAVDSSGNVYVADTANHIIWRIESGGETQYLRAQFIGPHAVAWIHPAISMWRILATTAYGKSHRQGR